MDFHYMWYEHHAAGGYPTILLLNSLPSAWQEH